MDHWQGKSGGRRIISALVVIRLLIRLWQEVSTEGREPTSDFIRISYQQGYLPHLRFRQCRTEARHAGEPNAVGDFPVTLAGSSSVMPVPSSNFGA
jgi:hypothetical protein